MKHGEIVDEVYFKYVRESKDLFRKWDSWSIDCSDFKEMNMRVVAVVFVDKENDIAYAIPKREIRITNSRIGEFNGKQLYIKREEFVSVEDWSTVKWKESSSSQTIKSHIKTNWPQS